MRILLLCSIFFVVASTTYLEDKRFPAQIDDDDSEIVIKNFNKCSKDQYFDLYKASCQKCTICPKGKFAINDCRKFDNTECGSCSNKDYSNTMAYRANCRGFPVRSGGYTIRNGMRKLEPSDIELPWNNIGEVRGNRSKRIVEIKLQSIPRDRGQDEEFDNEIPDLPGPFDDSDESMDNSMDDDYEEFYEGLDLSSEEFDDLETVDAHIILPASRPIIDETGVLEVMAMSDDSSDSDSSEESKSDSESLESAELRRLNWNPSEGKLKHVKKINEENPEQRRLFNQLNEGKLKHVKRISEDSDEIKVADDVDIDDDDDDDDLTTQAPTSKKFNLTESIKVWTFLTKFFVFIAYCFAVMALFVVFRYAQNMRRQRTFNVQPLVMTPEQHHDLIRSVNYLQSKRRGPFKYEPLEEFV